MGKLMALAALAASMLAGTAQAQHAISADEPNLQPFGLQPAGMREVCSTMDWGIGEIRTDCRTELLPPPKANPALRGICTIYYGRRTCY
jgi:hypothetical protein